MDVDLSDLANLEGEFYDVGYTEGYEHGRKHGLIEGRSLGKEKGFELWEEVGFYLGFASTWKEILQFGGGKESRAVTHLSHLLELIEKFPMVNPSASEQGKGEVGKQNTQESEEVELDVAQLISRIRARYKAACSILGIRPRPASSGVVSPDSDSLNPGSTEGNVELPNKPPSVWTFTEAVKRAGQGGMAF